MDKLVHQDDLPPWQFHMVLVPQPVQLIDILFLYSTQSFKDLMKVISIFYLDLDSVFEVDQSLVEELSC